MTAVIIGGSKGIGRAIALALSRPDNTVVINYGHDDAAAQGVQREIEQRGGKAVLIKGDIGSAEGAAALMQKIGAETETISQLVHCAVTTPTGKALSLSPADFNRALQVNGASLFYLVQSARSLFRAGSSIVFLSSYGSKVAIRGYMALGAPKALAEALIRYLSVELAPAGVRINAVTPTALPTDALRAIVPNVEKLLEAQAAATPMKRNPTFDDVTAAVKFLVSPEAGMITGQELVIDGGLYHKA